VVFDAQPSVFSDDTITASVSEDAQGGLQTGLNKAKQDENEPF